MTRSFKVAIHPVDVLLVEDNSGDVRLTREALKDAAVPIQLHVVPDGEEAMSFLSREGAYAQAPRPHLILLDLNLPKRDGRQVLKDIKENAALSSIPVVVLTTSALEADIAAVYRLHANCFITKPADFSGYFKVVQSIDSFWLSTVRLPQTAAPA